MIVKYLSTLCFTDPLSRRLIYEQTAQTPPPHTDVDEGTAF